MNRREDHEEGLCVFFVCSFVASCSSWLPVHFAATIRPACQIVIESKRHLHLDLPGAWAQIGGCAPLAPFAYRASRGLGEVPGTGFDRHPSVPHTHVEAVPSVLRHAARRVAHEIAVPEFVEDTEKRRAEVGGLLNLE